MTAAAVAILDQTSIPILIDDAVLIESEVAAQAVYWLGVQALQDTSHTLSLLLEKSVAVTLHEVEFSSSQTQEALRASLSTSAGQTQEALRAFLSAHSSFLTEAITSALTSLRASPERTEERRPAPDSMLELKWLQEHQKDYAGEWVALDGDQLIARGSSAREVYQNAKRSGIQVPFIAWVESEEDQLPFGGW